LNAVLIRGAELHKDLNYHVEGRFWIFPLMHVGELKIDSDMPFYRKSTSLGLRQRGGSQTDASIAAGHRSHQ
jgi:hypothetical protein